MADIQYAGEFTLSQVEIIASSGVDSRAAFSQG